MIKYKSKIVINNKNYKLRKNINPNSFFSQNKDSITMLREQIFKQVQKLDKQGSNAYVLMNEKQFKHLLLSKEYVDVRYIAMQIYLLQDNIGGFKYDEINKSLKTFINFIEKTLLKGRTISFDDVFYLSGTSNDKWTINKRQVVRVSIFRRRPKGIVFALKDIEINLDGTHEFALHELIIKHFNNIFLNLLQTKGQVLLGNLLVLQLANDYAVVVSERFLIGLEENKINDNFQSIKELNQSSSTLDTINVQTKKTNIFFKTEQIFLHRKNKRFKANNHIKIKKAKKLHLLIPKEKIENMNNKKTIFGKKQDKLMDTKILKKEIHDSNKLIGFFKFKKTHVKKPKKKITKIEIKKGNNEK